MYARTSSDPNELFDSHGVALTESKRRRVATTRMSTSWNPAAERLFGYPPQDAVGMHIDVLIFSEDRRAEGWQRHRLMLSPGMTGQWQVLGSPRIPLNEMLKIDYIYGANWSLWLDVKILLRTVPFVLARRGKERSEERRVGKECELRGGDRGGEAVVNLRPHRKQHPCQRATPAVMAAVALRRSGGVRPAAL